MRSISIHRAFAKVRGVPRRLAALHHWAQAFADYQPAPKPEQQFQHWKIPVLDRLVDPPTSQHKIQKQAIQSLLLAADHLAKNASSSGLPYCRAAVLLTLPYLHQSEVTLFFDKDYYQGFYYQQDLLPKAQKPSQVYRLSLPAGFVELGNLVEWDSESEDGDQVLMREQWWTIGQPL